MRLIPIAIGLLLFAACNVEPVAIEYNHDECAYCKMKISDVRFGAEMVTKKGKIFKFDSAECLIRSYNENSDQQYAHVIVSDYSRPHTLIDALPASFLISDQIPSPMGGNLSAYEDADNANKILKQKGGELFTFDQIVAKYKLQYK
ncbi:nitrous oxide reductase accessory protein NosL [Portibacter lacus]|uniref:Uncharacterized protein n=1 Tax=Portibacter lacus TaxID=1099794 RepID=A0AA37SPL9_9BACT|nr:nitrous oxide reductase accessory protein NosL [Portibacter lacus]GLR17605.1 hypothetical protein GCM10007940_22200 [Portibacter lacus]